MKANKFLVLLLLTVTLFSCKDGETKPEETVKATKNYVFTLNAVVKANDDFQIFYKEDNNSQTPYDESKSVWSGVNGSDKAQDIVFTFPEDVYPTQIRFDFGQNDQSEILINSLKVSYENKDFTLKGSEFFNYFIPDENFVKIDQAGSKIIPISQAGGKFDPMLFSNENFTVKLAQLLK